MTIELPTDTKPSRIHRAPTSAGEASVDDVTQTLAAYERLAIGSGALVKIEPPEFSGDAELWGAFWPGPGQTGHPIAARATVWRDGVETTVYVSWAESEPEDEAWRELRGRKPMQVFGAYAIRAALRRAFRDVIPDRPESDEKTPPSEHAEDGGAASQPAPRVVATPTDIAAALARLPQPPVQRPRDGRRPQRQKPRGDRG